MSGITANGNCEKSKGWSENLSRGMSWKSILVAIVNLGVQCSGKRFADCLASLGTGCRDPSLRSGLRRAQTSANAASLRGLLYGFTGGFSRSQCSTHFTVLTSTLAFLCPEKVMSGRMNNVCEPLATLKLQLKLIDWTPRSLHPVWSSASVRLTVLS